MIISPIQCKKLLERAITEAMACGTTAIGFNRGFVPKVIENGITGFVVKTMDKMWNILFDIEQIERKKCRESAKSKFDVPVIGNQYLNL